MRALGHRTLESKNLPILQGAPLCPGGQTQAPVSGWHLSPGPHWHSWEQLTPNSPGGQPGENQGGKQGSQSQQMQPPLG